MCRECVDHHDEPACATACPTEGCITWDAKFAGADKAFFSGANYIDGLDYVVENADAEMPFRDDISDEDRINRANVVD